MNSAIGIGLKKKKMLESARHRRGKRKMRLMNLLFIGLIALLMSHEQCNRRWIKKKKKTHTHTHTRLNQLDVDVGSAFSVCLDITYFAKNLKQYKINFRLLFTFKSTVHMPICTVHNRRWLKKKKKA